MAASLDAYRAKRDFTQTPEPKPKRGRARKGAGRFVVQKHDASRLHYDFRLEHDGVLKSWAVTRGPSLDPSDKRLAVETEDHPLDYAGFEGVIPSGYGAGTVMVWDEGTWAMVDGKDADEGLAAGSLSFELFGTRLKGRWHLQRLKSEAKRPPQWLLIKTRDDEAREGEAITDEAVTSVETGRTLEEIAADADREWHSDTGEAPGKPKRRRPAKAAMPAFVPPMLCETRTAPPAGEGWLAEVKYDGYRAILRAGEDGVAIVTRGENDWTHRFPTIAEAAKGLAPAMLDGEVVVFDTEGRTDFSALQRAFRSNGAVDAVFVAFDLLFLDGEDWRGKAIEVRKARLATLLEGGTTIQYGDHLEGRAAELFAEAERQGLEGIVAKRAGSRYQSGRQGAWVKVRATRDAPFVIGGYTRGENGGLGALVVGAWGEGGLVPVGRVGTGFSAAEIQRVLKALAARETKENPFRAKLAIRGVRYVRPELVATIRYLTFTADGNLRHPVYAGLVDLAPEEVLLPSDHPASAVDRAPEAPARRGASRAGASGGAVKAGAGEGAGGGDPSVDEGSAGRGARAKTAARPRTASARGSTGPVPPREPAPPATGSTWLGVTLSHPEKVLFPEQAVTKAALAAHYVHHMERMFPHIEGRPLTLVRCPQGRGKKCFYQRHPEGLPERMAADIGEDAGLATVIREPRDVIELVQRGVLEIHLRGAKADKPTRPDRLVFDLDPGEDVPFEEVKAAAVTVREALEADGLVSFLKTTGGKGLHVVVPIERRNEWDEAKAWTRAFASRLADTEPGRFLITMTKAKRTGRIFIDYLRNDWKSSAVAPYSTRAREGAPFGVPLSWDELPALESASGIHVGEVVTGPDPWAEMGGVKQRLTAAHLRAIRRTT